jgi:HlyD family secretion protein
MNPTGDRLTSDLAALKIDRDEPPRRGVLRPFLLLALAAAVVLGVWLVGYPYLNARIFKTPVDVTEVALVSPAQGSIELTSTGYVVPLVQAKVAAKAIGRIAELKVKEGDVIKRGDVIAQLDDVTSRSNVAAARTRIATARARAQASRAQLAETQQQVAREKVLVERGVTPKAIVEDLVAHQRSLAENVRAADAEVRAAQAEVEILQANLADLVVTAPIDGTIVEKLADVGELVGPQAMNVVAMVDFSSLIVEIDVPEGKLSLVKVGSPCEIVLDAFPGRRYRGAAHEIGKRVDRAKATVKVKVRFVDPPEGALPDMSARVSFLSKELDAAAMKEPARLVVPESALLETAGGGKAVYVVTTEGRLALTDVQVGEKLGSGFVLTRGPTAGTKVVANPNPELRDGQNIKERND